MEHVKTESEDSRGETSKHQELQPVEGFFPASGNGPKDGEICLSRQLRKEKMSNLSLLEFKEVDSDGEEKDKNKKDAEEEEEEEEEVEQAEEADDEQK